MKKIQKKNKKMSSRHILLIVVVLCIAAMILTTAYSTSIKAFQVAAEVVFAPMQSGLNKVSSFFASSSEASKSNAELVAENQALQKQIDELEEKNSSLTTQLYELDDLRNLYELDGQYEDYEKVGAYVIAKDGGNWFDSFTIDKGSEDGLEVGMNVLASGGLAGIITDVGLHTATVRSIIDNSSDISAMLLTTNDNCIVTGSLTRMTSEGAITFSELADDKDAVATGDAVVTSYISDRYLPGLVIGYVKSIQKDSNNLTKSGTITPVVDFRHIREVLVILDKKETE